MNILVINAGSSSIKYQLFDMVKSTVLTAGLVEKIGEPGSQITFTLHGRKQVLPIAVDSHKEGLAKVAGILMDADTGVVKSAAEIAAVGHRVVHGGEAFSQTVVIDQQVKDKVRELIPLAPLHNPANLQGIEVAEEVFPDAVQVAVFDTAFHQSMPPRAFRYAIPNALYHQLGIRAYGFHGTSHKYVAREAARFLGKGNDQADLITLHLGNGCSAAAIKQGKCIDTSMGLSPLPGLVMGTRSGDIDPTVLFFLGSQKGMSLKEIDQLLNKESGLKGLAGDNDLRAVAQSAAAGEETALLAIEIYAYRIRKYIGSYVAALGNLDALVFTAGVGENSSLMREMACQGLGFMGMTLDAQRNAQKINGISEISTPGSKVKILVVPTNEELEIANQTLEVLQTIQG